LFGEHFEVLETQQQWAKIRLQYDRYEGWIDSKQYQKISENDYRQLSEDAIVLNADLVEYITAPNSLLMPIPLGASLSFLNHPEINTTNFEFEGLRVSGIKPKPNLVQTAFLYLNAPYLWGRKNTFWD
jgi:hypothetical protein